MLLKENSSKANLSDMTSLPSPSKQHSQEADELDWLCRKLSDVRVHPSAGTRSAPSTTAKAQPSTHSADTDDDLRLRDLSVEQMAQLIHCLRHRELDPVSHKAAIVQFRKLLAHQDIAPYLDRIVDTDILMPSFVVLISEYGEDVELQFESAWILTNIAAGTSYQTQAVVRAGAIPHLVQQLSRSPHKEIQEQCIWALGNIAGDGVECRQKVLDENALQVLVELITREMNLFLAAKTYVVQSPTFLEDRNIQKESHYNLSTLRIAIWALSNFCRGQVKSELDWNLVRTLLLFFAYI